MFGRFKKIDGLAEKGNSCIVGLLSIDSIMIFLTKYLIKLRTLQFVDWNLSYVAGIIIHYFYTEHMMRLIASKTFTIGNVRFNSMKIV